MKIRLSSPNFHDPEHKLHWGQVSMRSRAEQSVGEVVFRQDIHYTGYVHKSVHKGDDMTTLTATEFRGRFFEMIKKSIRGHVPMQITSKAGDAVLVSKEDYESLIETLELLSTPGLRKSIREAREDIKAGRTKSMDQVFGV